MNQTKDTSSRSNKTNIQKFRRANDIRPSVRAPEAKSSGLSLLIELRLLLKLAASCRSSIDVVDELGSYIYKENNTMAYLTTYTPKI